MAISSDEEVNQSLVQFMDKLSGSSQRNSNWGWNMSSDPCTDKWLGVTCYLEVQSVWKTELEGYNLSGVFDASSICMFSGSLPDSLLQLGNLKRLDISNNKFTGELPDLHQISGLKTFFAQNNHLSGKIPNFDFSNFDQFNVSNNNFSGPIPNVQGNMSADSFLGSSELCGEPISTSCPPGAIIVLLIALRFIPKNVLKEEKEDVEKKGAIVEGDVSIDKPSETSNEFKFGVTRIPDEDGEDRPSKAFICIATDCILLLQAREAFGLRISAEWQPLPAPPCSASPSSPHRGTQTLPLPLHPFGRRRYRRKETNGATQTGTTLPLPFHSFGRRRYQRQEVKLPRPTRVKNKTPAPIQITAEQILREARERQEAEIRPPKQKITNASELANYRLRKRKEFEDLIRRVRWNIKRLDQVRVVGGVSEGLQSHALRLGTSSRGQLLEPHAVAEVRGGGDEEQVHQPRAQRLEPHSMLS
uniref:Leucine-rich repeat-containing N-terminal plant-type domain-containing protein n=1 Tax=Fagus sylvatica TaxID=28930 RepID=A0A2N9GH42_FAGSY